jgi:antitoxin component YwqK of YwqJK toxin-antitoxin module
MFKSTLTLLLVTLSSIACLGQMLDSVKINDEWRYVYPVRQLIDFDDSYYEYLGLRAEEFSLWMEWKMMNDPRAALKSKRLHRAIYAERNKRKEVRDSVPSKDDLRKFTDHSPFYDHKTKGEKELYYYLKVNDLENIPPVSQNLPSGKYILYYEPYMTLGKEAKRRLIPNLIAAKFELKNNELNHHFTYFNLSGDTLTDGIFNEGLKDGSWREVNQESLYFSAISGKLLINYKSGIRQGACYRYSENGLSSFVHLKDGALTGVAIELTKRDSIVYDVPESIDLFADYSWLSSVEGRVQSDVQLKKMNGNLPPLYFELYRRFPNWKRHWLGQTVFELPAKPVKPQDSAAYKRRFDNVPHPFRENPCFDTYYRKYDRQTKRLIYQFTLDTTNRIFSLASWFDNGQLFDSIWNPTGNSNFESIIYDQDGKELFSSLKKETPVYVTISGIEAAANFRDGKIDYYYLPKEFVRNDTVFQYIRWNRHQKPEYMHFHLVDDSLDQQMNFFEKSYLLDQEGTTFDQILLKEGDLTLINNQRTKSILRRVANVAPLQDRLTILVNGKEYEGEFLFKNNRAESTTYSLELKGLDRTFVLHSASERNEKSQFINEFFFSMLGFDLEDLLITSFQGTINNHRLQGKALIDSYRGINASLNYENGIPSGHFIWMKKNGIHRQKKEIQSYSLGSSYDFSMKGLKRKYLGQSFSLLNGKMDGPVVTYLSNGDTIGFIPFKDGLRNGKSFEITERRVVEAVFENDSLASKFTLLTRNLSFLNYDTLYFAYFDSKGNLESGFEKDDEGFELTTYQQSADTDGKVNYLLFEYGKLIESGLLAGHWYLNIEHYKNELLDYSQECDTAKQLIAASSILFYLNDKYYPDHSEKYASSELDDKLSLEFLYKGGSHYGEHGARYSHYFRKYFTNGSVSREGKFELVPNEDERGYELVKSGLWKVYNYEGQKIYELNYFDSLIQIGNEEWKIVGEQTGFDTLGNPISNRYVLFEDGMYECSSNDYYTERQYITVSHSYSTDINGWTRNYFDNGALMNEGNVENGLPEGLWKFYTPDGKLKRLGRYLHGKENGKWLIGDLGEKAYIGGVCIDPDDPHYEFNVHSLESNKEIEVIIYKKGVVLKRTNYGGNGGGEEIRSDIQLR